MIACTRWRGDFSAPWGTEPDPENDGDANLYGSAVEDGKLRDETMHRPVLDLDLPATLVASSTPGHHHLTIDLSMTWDRYVGLLQALAEFGIIQEGFLQASLARGGSFVRLPTVRKEATDNTYDAAPRVPVAAGADEDRPF